MNIFKCQHCGLVLLFENRHCERCRHLLGYVPTEDALSALEPADGDLWQALAAPQGLWRFCSNAELDGCNWLVPADSSERFCAACRHNRTVPDLSDADNLAKWRKMQIASHRLFYSLMRLRLPIMNRVDDPVRGLVFDFLADLPKPDGGKVLTGHDDGLITVALQEADDAERETRRTAMHEPYRTLLGHFRHEVGHYYWDRLVADENRLDECRAMFGDEREDYEEALKRHYQNGVPPDWQANFVSAYATTHPWEDFAETWAHYLHIVDSLETASAFGVQVHPAIASGQGLDADVQLDPYRNGNFDTLVDLWLPLTYALNAMNRSMGLNDLYPFVLSPPAIRKLAFVHDLIHAPRAS